ncbi:hypothetical protein G6F55_013118 [Rhizopus delemar]|nr:hypothetical protein G6F55_013118 [Rhizopus delemar]KAG1486762.1 hypothetical protein G6F54_013107 [Rhizopus delemar]KAG1499771.1 hypothetical protein G6F52_012623 [Rhizopus delemar]
MFRVFPPITSDILHLPLQQGGIGALDPTIQQQALQFRWLTPLFQHHYPLHLAAKWIGAHISSIAPIALFDHRLPFLFKVLRRNMLQQHHPGVCAILFRAFDGLYDSSTISGVLNIDLNTPDIFPLNLSLDLPVSSVIQYINDFCRKEQNSFGNILIRYVFEYVPVLDCLRRKVLPTERPNITFGRYQVQKLLCWITSNPLFKILVDPDVDPILQLISSKRFRQASLIKLLQTIPLSSPVRQNWYIFGNSFGVHKFLLPFEHRDTHA